MNHYKNQLAKIVVIIVISFIVIALYLKTDTNNQSFNNRQIAFYEGAIDKFVLIANANDFIYRYVDLPLEWGMGSAVIPLVACGLITTGNILELGMGTYSTNVLHKIGAHFNRHVTSVDHDKEWLNRFIVFNTTKTHTIYHMEDVKQLLTFGSDRQWGMVLVDHKLGEERYKNIIDLANKASIVLAHDAERNGAGNYRYVEKRVTDYYKYNCKFSIYNNGVGAAAGWTSTLIMSNSIDITFLEDVFMNVKYDRKVVACDFLKH